MNVNRAKASITACVASELQGPRQDPQRMGVLVDGFGIEETGFGSDQVLSSPGSSLGVCMSGRNGTANPTFDKASELRQRCWDPWVVKGRLCRRKRRVVGMGGWACEVWNPGIVMVSGFEGDR